MRNKFSRNLIAQFWSWFVELNSRNIIKLVKSLKLVPRNLIFFRHKDYKNKIIIFSQNSILENALIQLPLFPSLRIVYFSQKKTHFSCYFLFFLWSFESANGENRFRKFIINDPVMKINSAKCTAFWPVNREKLFRENFCPGKFTLGSLGSMSFCQLIGIPVGFDPAPFMANQFLYYYERKKLLLTKKQQKTGHEND